MKRIFQIIEEVQVEGNLQDQKCLVSRTKLKAKCIKKPANRLYEYFVVLPWILHFHERFSKIIFI